MDKSDSNRVDYNDQDVEDMLKQYADYDRNNTVDIKAFRKEMKDVLQRKGINNGRFKPSKSEPSKDRKGTVNHPKLQATAPVEFRTPNRV